MFNRYIPENEKMQTKQEKTKISTDNNWIDNCDNSKRQRENESNQNKQIEWRMG